MNRRIPVTIAGLLTILVLVLVSRGCSSRNDKAAKPSTVYLTEHILQDDLDIIAPPPRRTVKNVSFNPGNLSVVGEHFDIDPDSIQLRDGALRFRTTGGKPWIDIAVDVDASEVTEVRVKMRRNRSHNPPALLWTYETNRGRREPRARGSALEVVGRLKDDYIIYHLPVTGMDQWRGRIHSVRIWPGNQPDLVVDIQDIMFDYLPAITEWSARNEEVRNGHVAIYDETRQALIAPTPSRYDATFRIPENGRLSFGHAILPISWRVDTSAAFSVSVVDGSGTPERVYSYEAPVIDQAQAGWLDVDVSLARFAGKEVTVRLETTSGSPDAIVNSVWSDPVAYAPLGDAESGSRPKNIVLVSLDTLRADHLADYGYPRMTAPAFTRFSRENVVFDRFVSQAASTGPSHMSLFLSMFPSAHGIVNHEQQLSRKAVTLAEIYRDAGYRTAAFTEGGYTAAEIGFYQGFSSYAEVVGPMDGRGGYADVTFPRAADWIERNRDQPFVLFVQSYQVHVPYCPGEPWVDLYRGGYNGPLDRCVGYGEIGAMNYEAMGLPWKLEKNHGKNPPTPEDIEYLVALYDAEIRKIDSWFAHLLDTLEEQGLAEDTIVVVFSDHGEDFGDHLALGRHARSLYDEMVHVPLAMRIPGGPNRMRIPDMITSVDLLPTLLELTGVSAPKNLEPEGASLVPLLEGRELESRPAYAENYSDAIRAMIRRGNWKLIHTREFEDPEQVEEHAPRTMIVRGLRLGTELYDLENDPGETRDLSTEEPAILEELMRELERFLEKQEGRALPSGTRGISAGELERLRKLGYAEDEEGSDTDGTGERE